MKLAELPFPLRRLLAGIYLLLAVGGVLLVVLFPGEPPLAPVESLLQVDKGHFVDHAAALGKGADHYDVNVLSDIAGVIASAAADYPDGSNALLAFFDSREATLAAQEKLAGMIPHQQEKQDLWARHFAADSGDYVMLAVTGRILVMIIAQREALARQRLAALPALHYNADPGLGALLVQQSSLINLLLLGGYTAVQWLLVRMLFVWAGIGSAARSEAGA
jgi:hypothetical protein